MIFEVVLTLALLALLASCSGLKRFQNQYLDAFDTVTVLTDYAKDEAEFNRRSDAFHNEFLKENQLFDIYNDYEGITNLKTVNDHAGREPVRVDPDIISLLKLGRELYTETGGKVNIAGGSVLKLWHKTREAGIADPAHAALPDENELREASEHTDISKLQIDETKGTVYLADPGMSLDVGSIAKGFAVERAKEKLEAAGCGHSLINAGGNVEAISNRGDGRDWVVPVQNPYYIDGSSDQRYAAMVGLSGKCLVTSGDYERYYTVNGQRYHHIIDPDTLYPGTIHRSVTILADDSGLADGLSTALFLMDNSDGRALLDSLNEGAEEGEKIEAFWINADGSVEATSGFQDFVQKDKSY